MKPLIILSLLILNFYNAKSQNEEVTELRQNTLTNIRYLRDKCNKYSTNISSVDSLKKNLSTLIDLATTTNDSQELVVMFNYFLMVKKIVDDTTEFKNKSDIEVTARNINKDILLKLVESKDSLFNIEGSSTFGVEKEVTVTAFIGSSKPTGTYRLYWAFFRGRKIETLIKNKSFQGSSDDFNNPYKIKVTLPGFITFWLEDTQTHISYKPDVIYKEWKKNDSSSITITFSK